MKKCSVCGIEKESIEFYKRWNMCKKCHNLKSKVYRDNNKDRISESKKKWREDNKDYLLQKEQMKRDSHTEFDKKQISEYNKTYMLENKEILRQKKRQYYLDNKEYFLDKVKKYREENNDYVKKYREEYKEQRNINRNDRLKNDVLFLLEKKVRGMIYSAFKKSKYSKKSRTYQILGCSYEEFKIYLESKFELWMTWENRGLYNGKLNFGWDIDHIIPISSAKTEEDIIKLNHYTNLQPLCSKINRDIKRNSL